MEKHYLDLYQSWKDEEKIAHIQGWDFSHLDQRYCEAGELPWDFLNVIHRFLTPKTKLLDMDTGGGEFLLEIGHPTQLTSATEGYPPNVAFCQKKLLPLGIDFREASGDGTLPFANATFDLITNRHGSYQPKEIKRILKPGGLFITQQVGVENDKEFIELLTPENRHRAAFSEHFLATQSQKFADLGFEVLESAESFPSITFYDVGALVWFARIISWEFPYFSVDSHLPNLYKAQQLLERDRVLQGTSHRFYFVARKS